jgi:Di-haem oxidoreductase, putative peroxidase
MNRAIGLLLALFLTTLSANVLTQSAIGREVAVPTHLADGQEFSTPLGDLIAYGRALFTAVWTIQEGGGRPGTKGTGAPLADPASPLEFPRNFNRISAPDANSCAGCHNAPFGIPGGGGDIVANVFVLGQRFDFATFDAFDTVPTRGAVDEAGLPVNLQTIADSRNTLGMFGSGFIEMLARQITVDLRATRDVLGPGQSAALTSTGISFGRLARDAQGRWITSGVQGLSPKSLVADGSPTAPSLVVRPFHQAGAVVSLREFSNNAFNHHHGIQSTERFGDNTDPDGDGFTNELTRADVTAVSIFQATMAVPGRVIPRDREIEEAVWTGEQAFAAIGCASCHIPALPLTNRGWIYSEPNPFNPPGNVASGRTLSVDLTDPHLPGPRLEAVNGVVMVPAYTDLKLHDITSGPADPNRESIDMQFAPGSAGFLAGNGRFVTRKLWGTANEPPFYHHGMYTTLRQAVLAHAGEAAATTAAFNRLSPHERDCVIEFLKSLQVLPPGTRHLIVDERGNPRRWPPRRGRDSHDGDR